MYFEPALQGEKLGAIGMTEAEAGSDLAGLKTTAVRDGDAWVLNGTKMWLTNGGIGDFFTIAAVTGETIDKRGNKRAQMSLFLVDAKTPGFNVGKPIPKMAVTSSPTTELSMDNCRLPADALLGEEGKGFDYLKEVLCEIRTMTGALGLGCARAALELATKYAGEREQFGQSIRKFQGVSFKLAEMAMALEQARLIVHKAAWHMDQGEFPVTLASMAKVAATECAVKATDDAMRIFASYGLSLEYPIQRHFRDARFLLVGGGTSEILKAVIASDLFA
jgi:butyryl-CoA dehydrogenase